MADCDNCDGKGWIKAKPGSGELGIWDCPACVDTDRQPLLDEASDHLATYADHDDRARELAIRLELAAHGIEEAWAERANGEAVQWEAPNGARVYAEENGDTWEAARFPPEGGEPEAGNTLPTLAEAASYARDWLTQEPRA